VRDEDRGEGDRLGGELVRVEAPAGGVPDKEEGGGNAGVPASHLQAHMVAGAASEGGRGLARSRSPCNLAAVDGGAGDDLRAASGKGGSSLKGCVEGGERSHVGRAACGKPSDGPIALPGQLPLPAREDGLASPLGVLKAGVTGRCVCVCMRACALHWFFVFILCLLHITHNVYMHCACKYNFKCTCTLKCACGHAYNSST